MKTPRRINKNRALALVRILAPLLLFLGASALVFLVSRPATAPPTARPQPLTPHFSTALAFDVSPALRNLPRVARPLIYPPDTLLEVRERGPEGPRAHRVKPRSADGALQLFSHLFSPTPSIPAPLLTFVGLSNLDNFNVCGSRVNPPDPNGEVGPNNYVEIINLVFGVYDRAGNLLVGPIDTGSLWADFPIEDCTDPSGDPVVLYDQLVDRWLLSQFTTRGMNPDGTFNGLPFYNCVAISQTGDPTGAYFRYAFITSGAVDLHGTNSEPFFPDYPKYGVWGNSYLLTSRDFGRKNAYGISVYALEKERMVAGDPNARMVHFFLDGNNPAILPLVGDGLLPADIDG